MPELENNRLLTVRNWAILAEHFRDLYLVLHNYEKSRK